MGIKKSENIALVSLGKSYGISRNSFQIFTDRPLPCTGNVS